MSRIERILVEAPVNEARRDRIERAVFAQLDAIRVVQRTDAALPASRARRHWLSLGLAGAAVAAAIVFVVMRGETRRAGLPSAGEASLVTTPVGGSSRFTVGDAVIDAGSDTSVEVRRGGDGSTTLALERGSVDCDVEPRPDRAPFRVIAGDVTVTVVGTRFMVARDHDATRVDVTRGKVRVQWPAGERLLDAGQAWSSATLASAPPVPPAELASPEPMPTVVDNPAPVASPAPSVTVPQPTTSSTSAKAAFRAAERLESTDPAKAVPAYRAVANGKDAWAALALYSLAQLHASRGDTAIALRELDEYARRFPRSVNAEDAAWLRVEILRGARRLADARRAAERYLREFPDGTYAKHAAQLVRSAPP